MATCRSCGARITFARTVNGKTIPLDPEPVPNGNVVFTGRGTVEVLGVEALVDEMGTRYVSHFATCPFAKTHRRT